MNPNWRIPRGYDRDSAALIRARVEDIRRIARALTPMDVELTGSDLHVHPLKACLTPIPEQPRVYPHPIPDNPRISDYIYRLRDLLEQAGLLVDLYASNLVLPVIGRYHHERQLIEVNVFGARDALLVLAHEAGHWWGCGTRESKLRISSERQACVYGWRVLQAMGVPESIVSRSGWMEWSKPL